MNLITSPPASSIAGTTAAEVGIKQLEHPLARPTIGELRESPQVAEQERGLQPFELAAPHAALENASSRQGSEIGVEERQLHVSQVAQFAGIPQRRRDAVEGRALGGRSRCCASSRRGKSALGNASGVRNGSHDELDKGAALEQVDLCPRSIALLVDAQDERCPRLQDPDDGIAEVAIRTNEVMRGRR